jgi:CheY-like chemotaxis protein
MATDRDVAILIVDDDEDHIELARRSLRRAGIEEPIRSFLRGEEALDYILRRGDHAGREGHDELVVLLDINMPTGIDGIEVLRRLQAEPQATSGVSVIMLTTADDPAEIDLCFSLGCRVFMTKPLDPAAFIQELVRVARGQAP